MKSKRKPNGHKERREKQANKRNFEDRKKAYPTYKNEFDHLESSTIIGKNHKSAMITLAKRGTKLIIGLEMHGRRAEDIETALNNWFKCLA